MSWVWIAIAGGGVLVAGWTALCAKRIWIPNYREKKRQEEVLARGRRVQ
jgi:hypothetical protein